MVIYRVEITLDSEIEAEWLQWMQAVHVKDVLQTGCFSKCVIYKVIEPPAEEPRYVMQYDCASIDDYQRYREQFAATLQKEHSDRFAGRFRGNRQVLQEVED